MEREKELICSKDDIGNIHQTNINQTAWMLTITTELFNYIYTLIITIIGQIPKLNIEKLVI